ncbi:hypothetical protein M3O96_00190 [Aquiflexum sp. TKW24L]|uniref:hypothetical protein n=1 Tax=Aquiflexum sp. TKW24L TaxID=2942212 RepID=UPI0020C071FC|nr:hypothetical protein [Aquiflexum sp. TKW24L]MCL6257488.1 hypothetical protein [Aquiflexum sp. TKW24L]
MGLDAADTLSWDYFEGMAQGDKIRVTDKTKNSQDILFSSASEGMLYGQAFRDAYNLKKVDPHDFSIPIKRISQVKEIGKSRKLKNDEKPKFSNRDLYKIKMGSRVSILKKNGELQYLYFKEFKDGVVYGDTWGSNKNDRNKVPTKAIGIPISEIEEITVRSFNFSRTGLLTIGIAGAFLGIIIIAYITDPIYLN